MFELSVPWWELVVRSMVVYITLLLLLRLTGKRQIGQLASFDLVMLLVLSNAVQNSMNAGDASLVGGLISAITLISLNYLLGIVTFRSRGAETLLDGSPQLLIRDGELYEDVLKKNMLTRHELDSALRQAGCRKPQEVALAFLEINGAISVIKGAETAHTHGNAVADRNNPPQVPLVS